MSKVHVQVLAYDPVTKEIRIYYFESLLCVNWCRIDYSMQFSLENCTEFI